MLLFVIARGGLDPSEALAEPQLNNDALRWKSTSVRLEPQRAMHPSIVTPAAIRIAPNHLLIPRLLSPALTLLLPGTESMGVRRSSASGYFHWQLEAIQLAPVLA